MRALQLYFMNLKSFWLKLRYDWAREITVMLCSTVLLATFFYVFNDFLNNEVKQISLGMHQRFGRWAAIVALGLSSAYLANIWLQEGFKAKHSLSLFALSRGELPRTVMAFLIIRQITLAAIILGFAWYIISNYMSKFTFSSAAYWQIGALTAATLLVKIINRNGKLEMPVCSLRSLGMTGMMRWRLVQILTRNHRSQLMLLLSGATLVIQFALMYKQAPLFLNILVGFLSGWTASSALNFQLTADLKYAWLERLAGVSHSDYLKAYEQVGYLLSLTLAALTLLITLSSGALAWQDTAKIILAVIIPIYLMPALAMQIDAKRPVIQMITGFLVSIFLVTACYAHILSVIIVPFAAHYAHTQQHDRFYRC